MGVASAAVTQPEPKRAHFTGKEAVIAEGEVGALGVELIGDIAQGHERRQLVGHQRLAAQM